MTSAGTMISLPVLEPPKRSHVHLPGAQTLPVYFGEQRPRTHSTCRIPAGYTEKIRAPNGILSIGKGGQALLLSANFPQNLFTSKRQSLAPHKRQKSASWSCPSAPQPGQACVETGACVRRDISTVTMPVGTAMIP